jgi:hypothetical protein
LALHKLRADCFSNERDKPTSHRVGPFGEYYLIQIVNSPFLEDSYSGGLENSEASQAAEKKVGNPGFILRQAQDEAEQFQWLEPHGEPVEPWGKTLLSTPPGPEDGAILRAQLAVRI